MPVRATKRGDERTPLDGSHDVLICGASFAGLAVARELAGSRRRRAGRRPLRDRRAADLGLRHPDRVAARRSGLRTPSASASASCVDPHPPRRPRATRLPWTFSTFDYRELCELLWARLRRQLRDRQGRTAAPRPANGDGAIAVETDRGVISAPLVVDALGWRRMLGQRRRLPAARRAALARPRGPSRRQRRGPRDLDRPPLRPRRLRLVASPPTTSCGSASAPSTPASTSRSTTELLAEDLGSEPRPLPGQLDPAQAAPRRPRAASSSPATRPATACR